MLTPEIIAEINTLIRKKSTPEQIQQAVDAARVVYEKHMGKFPPVPDAVFLEMFDAFNAVSKQHIDKKLGIDVL